MTESDIERLKHIAEVEDGTEPESLIGHLGWRSRDVGIWPGTLSKLRMNGFIEDIYESNFYHGYRLSQKARAMLVTGEPEHRETEPSSFSRRINLPDDLFEDVIGHDDVKELLRASVTAEKPVHVLLAGPPVLAKTLFLWDIERALGEEAVWLVGSATSKSGLWDLVVERQPRVLLIDELDKMNAADTTALLSMMEGGRLVRVKKGRDLSLELAEEIAERLDGRSQDVRDAVRVAASARD